MDSTFPLSEMGGWAMDCFNARRFRSDVEWALRNGFLAHRTHYTRMGDTWEAYELTDAAIDYLRSRSGEVADRAIKARDFYRNSASELAD